MSKIHPDLSPQCRYDNDERTNPLQLGASGNVRPCNYYGSRFNWKHLESWAKEKNFDMSKLNIRNSTMKEICESDVFKAILDGHETLDLPSPCLRLCLKKNITTPGMGYKETDSGFSNE